MVLRDAAMRPVATATPFQDAAKLSFEGDMGGPQDVRSVRRAFQEVPEGRAPLQEHWPWVEEPEHVNAMLLGEAGHDEEPVEGRTESLFSATAAVVVRAVVVLGLAGPELATATRNA